MSNLQPTAEMVEAGIRELWGSIPGALDGLFDQMEESEVEDLLSDTIVFVWQAMKSKEEIK